MRDITNAVLPPRAVFLDFPPGHTAGPRFDQQLQDSITMAALRTLHEAETSGTIVDLPLSWPGGDAWKAKPLPDRLPRSEQPQYQCEADHVRAESHDAACSICLL
jgi:hypothetical protein